VTSLYESRRSFNLTLRSVARYLISDLTIDRPHVLARQQRFDDKSSHFLRSEIDKQCARYGYVCRPNRIPLPRDAQKTPCLKTRESPPPTLGAISARILPASVALMVLRPPFPCSLPSGLQLLKTERRFYPSAFYPAISVSRGSDQTCHS